MPSAEGMEDSMDQLPVMPEANAKPMTQVNAAKAPDLQAILDGIN